MLIHRVDTGESYGVEIDGNTLIKDVTDALRHSTGIPSEYQILLSEAGEKLDGSKTLSYYHLDDPKKSVFLYDRRQLLPDFPEPAPASPNLPPQTDQVRDALSDAVSTRPKTLPEFQPAFRSHLTIGESVLVVCEQILTNSKNMLSEQYVQHQGLSVAVKNLHVHQKHQQQALHYFVGQYKTVKERHVERLERFESDLANLQHVALDHALQSKSRRTLFDCVPAEKLRQWAKSCEMSHHQLEVKVSELETIYSGIEQGIKSEEEIVGQLQLDADVRTKLETGYRDLEECRTIVGAMQGDLNNVTQLMDQQALSPLPNPDDHVDALSTIAALHLEKQLPRLEEILQNVIQVYQVSLLSKSGSNSLVHSRLRSVSSIQSQIKSLSNNLALDNEWLNQQKGQFSELAHVQKMPSAYYQGIVEVVRRRTFQRQYHQKLEELTEGISRMREDEENARDKFNSEHGRYLPKDLILGLNEKVPFIEVTAPDFATNLPPIDNLADLDLPEDADHGLMQLAPSSDGSLLVPSGTENVWIGDAARERELEMKNLQLHAEIARLREREHQFLKDGGVDNPKSGLSTSKTNSASSAQSLEDPDVKAALERKDQEIAELKAKLGSASDTSSTTVDSSNEDVKAKYKELQTKNEDLKSRLKAAKAAESAIAEAKAMVNKEIEALRVETAKIIESSKQSAEERDVAKQELESARQQIETLESEVSTLKEEAEAIRAERDDALKTPQTKVSEEELSNLREELGRAWEEAESRKVELETTRNESDGYRKMASEANHALEELRQVVAVLQAQIDEKKQQLESMVQKCQELEGNSDHLKKLKREKSELAIALEQREIALSDSSAQANATLVKYQSETLTLYRGLFDIAKLLELLPDSATEVTSDMSEQLLSDIEAKAQLLQTERKEIMDRQRLTLTELENAEKEREDLRTKLSQKVSYRNFQVNDLAIFIKNAATGHYSAFNRNCPHHYLSQESLTHLQRKEGVEPSSVIGMIVKLEQRVAMKDPGGDPYGLRVPGAKFVVCTVEFVDVR